MNMASGLLRGALKKATATAGIQTGDRKTKQRISGMVAAEKARPTTDHTGCNANINLFSPRLFPV
jgi:hypothetical protein